MIKKEKKNVWLAEEKEEQGRKEEEIFWRRKIFGQWRRRRTRGKGIKLFGEEKGRNIWRWKLFGRRRKEEWRRKEKVHILEKEKVCG